MKNMLYMKQSYFLQLISKYLSVDFNKLLTDFSFSMINNVEVNNIR